MISKKINKNDYIEICNHCGKELKNNENICDCGCQSIAYGKNFSIKNKRINCNCGSEEFYLVFHANIGKKHVRNYKCKKCGNLIGIEVNNINNIY